MFHLFTHAFFKALLFLASGSVMHAMGGVIDMRRVRRPPAPAADHLLDLRRRGPGPLRHPAVRRVLSARTRSCSRLKLAGARVERLGRPGWGWVYTSIYWAAVLTAFMTAFYTGRAFFLTFLGPEKLPEPRRPRGRPRPTSPRPRTTATTATRTTTAMATATATTRTSATSRRRDDDPADDPGRLRRAGRAGLRADRPVRASPRADAAASRPLRRARRASTRLDWLTAIVGTLAGLLGLGLSYALYGKPSPIPARLAAQLGPLYRASLHKFYVDEIYDARRRLADAVPGGDGASSSTSYLVDGLVQGVSWIPRLVGRYVLGAVQNGLIQFYAAVTALGVGGLLLLCCS